MMRGLVDLAFFVVQLNEPLQVVSKNRIYSIILKALIASKLLFLFIFFTSSSLLNFLISFMYFSPMFFAAYSYVFMPTDITAPVLMPLSSKIVWLVALILIALSAIMALIFICVPKRKQWVNFMAFPMLIIDVISYIWSIVANEYTANGLTLYKYIGLAITAFYIVLLLVKVFMDRKYVIKNRQVNQ